jgi:O-antigen/teichoic acid export membrane protein
MQTMPNKLFLDGAWVLAGRVVSTVSGLLLVAMIARMLDTGEVGHYFLYFSLVSIFSIVTQFGLNLAVVRLIAEFVGKGKHAHAASIARISMRFVLTAVVVISCLGIFFINVHPPEFMARLSINSFVLTILFIWFSFATMQGLIAECLRGYRDVRAATVFGVALSSLLSVSGLALAWLLGFESNLEHVLAIIAASVAITTIAGFMWLGRLMVPGHGAGYTDLSGLISLAWPMWSTNITLLILTQADIWIIGSFLTVDDVALYGGAARLVIVVSISLVIINAVISPEIARMYFRNEQQELEKRLRTATTLAALPAGFAVVVFFLGGEWLLEAVYGAWYADGYPILLILSIGQFFNVIAGPCGRTLLMTGHQRVMMTISIFTGLLAIAASIYAAIYAGPLGVAVIFSCALILQNVLMNHYLIKYTGISTLLDIRLVLKSR